MAEVAEMADDRGQLRSARGALLRIRLPVVVPLMSLRWLSTVVPMSLPLVPMADWLLLTWGAGELPEGDGVTWAVCMASLARSVALGPVRTKVAVSERGTAFCVACCASWGVAPTVVGVLLVYGRALAQMAQHGIAKALVIYRALIRKQHITIIQLLPQKVKQWLPRFKNIGVGHLLYHGIFGQMLCNFFIANSRHHHAGRPCRLRQL